MNNEIKTNRWKNGSLMLFGNVGLTLGMRMIFKDQAHHMHLEQYYGAVIVGLSALVMGVVSGRIALIHKLNKQMKMDNKLGGINA